MTFCEGNDRHLGRIRIEMTEHRRGGLGIFGVKRLHFADEQNPKDLQVAVEGARPAPRDNPELLAIKGYLMLTGFKVKEATNFRSKEVEFK